MSLLGKIADIGRSILKSPAVRAVAPVLGGPVGIALAGASTAYGAYQALKTPAAGAVMPGAGSVTAFPSMPSLAMGMSAGGPAFSALGQIGGTIVRGAGAFAKKAVDLCKKYPQWCSTIGGTIAIEAMLRSGQIPMPKRRRGRGITATELKNFKRVARFTSKYCAPVRRAMSAPVMRRKRG